MDSVPGAPREPTSPGFADVRTRYARCSGRYSQSAPRLQERRRCPIRRRRRGPRCLRDREAVHRRRRRCPLLCSAGHHGHRGHKTSCRVDRKTRRAGQDHLTYGKRTSPEAAFAPNERHYEVEVAAAQRLGSLNHPPTRGRASRREDPGLVLPVTDPRGGRGPWADLSKWSGRSWATPPPAERIHEATESIDGEVKLARGSARVWRYPDCTAFECSSCPCLRL